jgi:adenylosuccinate lyase
MRPNKENMYAPLNAPLNLLHKNAIANAVPHKGTQRHAMSKNIGRCLMLKQSENRHTSGAL